MTEQTSGMHAGGIALTADRPLTTSDYLASLRQRDRVFWTALACALALHVLIVLAMLLDLGSNRSLGVETGASDTIAVEIVDGATLKDSMAPPTEATQPPGGQPTQTAATPPPEPPQPPPEPQAEPQPEPTPPAEAAVQPPTPPEAAPPQESPPTPEEAAKLAAEALPAFEEAPPAEKTELPKEAPKQEQPKPAQKVEQKQAPAKQQAKQQPPKKKTQTSALDLSVPYDGSDSDQDGGGSSSAVQRPPGITRSGENDEFARNVIRALQKTMPRERAHGRVTVRIVLNENGSRADVKLLQSGGNQDLDFNVVFAARGTAYPFPPKKSTLVDRTFTVTYIYR